MMGVHADKSRARLLAVQAVFQMEQNQIGAQALIAQYDEKPVALPEENTVHGDVDTELFRHLVTAVAADIDALDGRIRAVLQTGWTLERIDSVVRAILRTAVAELNTCPTAREIVLDEYIEVTRAFFEDTEAAFVNAALDRICADLPVT